MLVYSAIYIGPFVVRLYKMAWGSTNIKLKLSQMGGYSASDPQRELYVRESIYSLSFLNKLKRETLSKLDIPEEALPNRQTRYEVALLEYFCAFCQGLASVLLLQSFADREREAEEGEI